MTMKLPAVGFQWFLRKTYLLTGHGAVSSPISPSRPLPLKRGVRGPNLENFETLHCCRGVLAHICRTKVEFICLVLQKIFCCFNAFRQYLTIIIVTGYSIYRLLHSLALTPFTPRIHSLGTIESQGSSSKKIFEFSISVGIF